MEKNVMGLLHILITLGKISKGYVETVTIKKHEAIINLYYDTYDEVSI